jgi:hypothetical protein
MEINKNLKAGESKLVLTLFFIKINIFKSKFKTTFYNTYPKNHTLKNQNDFYTIYKIDSIELQNLAEEVYILLNERIETENLYMENYELMTELNGCYDKEDKVSFLKTTLKDLWKQDNLSGLFLSYLDKQVWKDNAIELFTELPNFLISYLKGELKEYSSSVLIEEDGIDEFIIEWIYFSKIKNLIHFCENQILELENISKLNVSNLDTSKQILLLEEILSDNNWSDYSASQKGRVVSQLIGKSYDNIKKFYAEIHKKPSESKKMNTNKFIKDKIEAKELYKKLIG